LLFFVGLLVCPLELTVSKTTRRAQARRRLGCVAGVAQRQRLLLLLLRLLLVRAICRSNPSILNGAQHFPCRGTADGGVDHEAPLGMSENKVHAQGETVGTWGAQGRTARCERFAAGQGRGHGFQQAEHRGGMAAHSGFGLCGGLKVQQM
jgi:hypothetical protein